MRALDKLISFVFSVIILIISIALILVGAGVVEPQIIIDLLNEYVFVKDLISVNTFNALTITGIVLFLASLKTTIFLSSFKTKDKSPILVKTTNGEVEIAQETITSTVKNVGLSFDNIKDVQAKMIKKRKGVVVYAMVLVYANSNIRETTEEMQKQVKEVIKATTGVNVIDVNIKVKNIYQKQKKNEEVSNSKVNLEQNVILESEPQEEVQISNNSDNTVKENEANQDSGSNDLDQITISENNIEEKK